jgi:hypothetical protein
LYLLQVVRSLAGYRAVVDELPAAHLATVALQSVVLVQVKPVAQPEVQACVLW